MNLLCNKAEVTVSMQALKKCDGFTSPVAPSVQTLAERHRYDAGFSLIELLVVMVIIVLITSLATPQVMRYLDRAKQDTARAAIRNIGTTLDMYRLDVGSYPAREVGLEALVENRSGIANWNGPYLQRKEMLLDPWGRPYHYAIPGKHGEYDLFSYGADDAEGGEGNSRDATNW